MQPHLEHLQQVQPLAYTQDADVPQAEELRPVASIPWVAIAAAVHVIVLVIAWFIIPRMPLMEPQRTIEAAVEQDPIPPTPEEKLEKENPFDDVQPDVTDPTEDVQITPEAQEDFNSDPSEKPFQELAEADNDDQDQSPMPRKATNTSAGLGGGASGGSGGGERGGLIRARARGRGNGVPTAPRVGAALDWLRDHQNAAGYWSATTFSQDSTRTGAQKTYNKEFLRVGEAGGDKGWESTVDVGLTGLAMLAFTGDLQTHKEGKYRENVRRAILYLRQVQGTDGCFGGRDDDHFVYNHAIATMAVAELYMITREPILRPVVERAVEFIVLMQNPGLGWRYGIKPASNDSSVTGWMVLTLHTAQLAEIPFDQNKCYSDADAWFNMVTIKVDGYERTGYDTPGSHGARLRSASNYDNVPSMDAIHIMSKLFMKKADLQNPVMRGQAGAITQQLPEWKLEKMDFYYWYYASLALFQMGGSHWDRWEKPMTQALLNSQRGLRPDERGHTKETLDEHGSWDPLDAWGAAGGRVYATAINCLTLQVWYRYERMQKQ